MKKILASLFIATALAAQEPPPPYTAAIVMEPSTGQVLFEKNSREPYPTASMTKMMTLLIALDQIREGSMSWDTPIKTSAHASRMGGSQVFLREGEVFPARDLMAATMIHSANDASMALAEHIGGTGEGFVRLMNQRAQQLGLKNTTYHSPHGLPGEGDPDDVMSPYDLAILGRELMKSPEMREWAGTQIKPFRNGEFIMNSPNHLLKDYEGATGIKTGFHDQAGFCVTGSARRGNMELIVVVMGSKIKRDNFQSAANLLSEAFASYRLLEPVKKGQTLDTRVPVANGAIDTVPVVAGTTGTVLIKRGQSDAVSTEIAPANTAAPIKEGQQVGWINLKHAGRTVGRVPALSAVNVEAAPWYKKMWNRLWPF